MSYRLKLKPLLTILAFVLGMTATKLVAEDLLPTRTADGPSEFMLYGNWPAFYSADGYASRLAAHKAAFEDLRDQLNSNRHPDVPAVYVIPSYEFIARIMQDVDSGSAVGIDSVSELFRDELHLSGIGQYGIACLTYATIFGRNPAELLPSDGLAHLSLTSEEVTYIRNVAVSVANTYGPAGHADRTPTALGTPHVFSGNSQTNGWFEYFYKPALGSNGQYAEQSIYFGSTAAQRWNEAEQLGVQLPENIRQYELVVAGVGPYFDRESYDAEADALRLFANATWSQ